PRHAVPAAEASGPLQPASDTLLAPRLYSSMKSFAYGAPVLPPPPYTWLIVMSGDTAPAGPEAVTATPPTAAAMMPSRTAAREGNARTKSPRIGSDWLPAVYHYSGRKG